MRHSFQIAHCQVRGKIQSFSLLVTEYTRVIKYNP